jgi:Ala-tRNA(Pro) deacylase
MSSFQPWYHGLELCTTTPTIAYPASQTVEEGKRLLGEMKGTFTKNLLLKDKKGNLFLLVFHEDRNLDLKTLHKQIGSNGQLGFASAEVMVELLGLVP